MRLMRIISNREEILMIYLQLFLSFFQVGLFSFGGGYAAVPLIQNSIVEQHGWLSLSQLADLITIAEMTPGPIAVNCATFVGIQVAGFPGAIVSTLGCICPSFMIVLLLAKLYLKFRNLKAMQNVLTGLRPAIVAMIASAGASLLLLAVYNTSPDALTDGSFQWVETGLFLAGFFLLRRYKTNPLAVIFGSGALGTLFYLGFGLIA